MMVAMWGLNAAENPWQTQAFCDFVVLLFRRVFAGNHAAISEALRPGLGRTFVDARDCARALVGDAALASLGGDDDGAAFAAALDNGYLAPIARGRCARARAAGALAELTQLRQDAAAVRKALESGKPAVRFDVSKNADLDAFLALATDFYRESARLQMRRLMALFAKFDVNGSGAIERDEFDALLAATTLGGARAPGGFDAPCDAPGGAPRDSAASPPKGDGSATGGGARSPPKRDAARSSRSRPS